MPILTKGKVRKFDHPFYGPALYWMSPLTMGKTLYFFRISFFVLKLIFRLRISNVFLISKWSILSVTRTTVENFVSNNGHINHLKKQGIGFLKSSNLIFFLCYRKIYKLLYIKCSRPSSPHGLCLLCVDQEDGV